MGCDGSVTSLHLDARCTMTTWDREATGDNWSLWSRWTRTKKIYQVVLHDKQKIHNFDDDIGAAWKLINEEKEDD